MLIKIILASFISSIYLFSNMEHSLSLSQINAINSQLNDWVNSTKYAGIINLTSIDSKIQHFEAFGFRDIKNKKPMKKDTIVRIYSMTKPIVSVAIMQLVEQGKLNLDDPITKYIPEFKSLRVYDKGSFVKPRKEITLRHLMTHTAGFSYGWSEHPVDKAYENANIWNNLNNGKDFIDKIAKLPLIYHPGEKWHYSISVDLQGILIERITKSTLSEYLQKNFFNPLGMKDTSFRLPESKISRFSENYKEENGELILAKGWRSKPYFGDSEFYGGGGGLLSTAQDYHKFTLMLLNGGTFKGKRFIKKETLDLMTRDNLKLVLDDPNDPWTEYSFGLDNSKFGLGFKLTIIEDPYTGEEITKQYSWNGAAGTEFWIDPLSRLINITLIQKINSDWTLRENMEKLVY